METLYPSIYNSNSNRFSQGIEWSVEENETFERALAIFDENEPDRWLKVAALIPGKSVLEVLKHYKELEDDVSDIEAGRVPIPGYFGSSSSSWEQNDDSNFPTNQKSFLTAKSGEHHRKKGVPWTEEEHRRFLMGLLKHGKGEWRNISRNFVVSKTPTQVASHAQKYFIRQQLSGAKDKRRPSIHDITTVSLRNSITLSDGGNPSYTDRSNVLLSQQKRNCMPEATIGLKNAEDGSYMVFGSTHCDLQLLASRHGISSDGLNFQPYAGAHRETLINPHDFLFQTPSPIHQIHGQVRHSFFSLGANRLIG